jgi:Domain of unknown function (DUF4262)
MRTMPFDDELLRTVDEFGWAVVESEASHGKPASAYTVGLYDRFGWPELICLGLEPMQMRSPLNSAIAEMHALQLAPVAGLVLKQVAVGVPCLLGAVTRQRMLQHLPLAERFARKHSEKNVRLQALQLIWPDRLGRFPFDLDCALEVRSVQPLLSS